ncbi:uncharacterized protein At5g43822 isoform X2 [Syzygium oleosum]|uniref:uncharacterized protein At5g43822 isoform X2 n=1 Tax=Syzygium oleosum TaxID=219896 RepID=UPI0024BBC184|nr:uncharacterized protein At5g43822 isoform X2 [Syzygium oleosum]
MEAEVRKFQQKFKRVREEMDRWGELQVRLVSQFRNASSIMDRLQVIRDGKNYGTLKSVGGIGEAVWTKQMESLEATLLSMRKTMEEFHGVVMSLEKIHRDGKQLVKGGSRQPSVKHLQQRVGVKPCLQDCLDGLMILYEMHCSDASDLHALQQLLVDQPNIPKEEVQFIYDIIFAEEIC